MPKIDKDTETNERKVAVDFLQHEVITMLENIALETAGIKRSKAVKLEVDLTKSTDSSGYTRQTEALAVGARVKITVDHNYVEEIKDEERYLKDVKKNNSDV